MTGLRIANLFWRARDLEGAIAVGEAAAAEMTEEEPCNYVLGHVAVVEASAGRAADAVDRVGHLFEATDGRVLPASLAGAPPPGARTPGRGADLAGGASPPTAAWACRVGSSRCRCSAPRTIAMFEEVAATRPARWPRPASNWPSTRRTTSAGRSTPSRWGSSASARATPSSACDGSVRPRRDSAATATTA